MPPSSENEVPNYSPLTMEHARQGKVMWVITYCGASLHRWLWLGTETIASHKNLHSFIPKTRVNLPLIHKGEFAIHGVAGDKFSRLDLDLSVGLWEGVGVHAAHCYQAAEVGALFIRLSLPLRAQLARGPGAHVPRAVHSAVPLWLCWGSQSKQSQFTGELWAKCSTICC